MKKQIALSITVPDRVYNACSQKPPDSALLKKTNVRLWQEPDSALTHSQLFNTKPTI